MKHVTFFGAGYVGLTTAAFFAGGHKVTIFDPDNNKLEAIRKVLAGGNEIYIHEKGLIDVLHKNCHNIAVTDDPKKALASPDIVFIAVGTPPNSKHRANLSYVVSAAKMVGQHVPKSCIVLTKSTVPPGTGYVVENIMTKELKKRNVNFQISIGSSPEFLAEGTAMDDLRLPARLVVGMDNKEKLQDIIDFFTTMYSREKVFATTLLNAELIKYASNAMLASRISFVNNLGMFCDAIGADINAVSKGMGMDPRIGSKFLRSGFGYGGSCFPKDTKAIAEYAKLLGTSLHMIDMTVSVNDEVLKFLEEKIVKVYGKDLSGKHFALWGIGFKSGTDDIRDSRSVALAQGLIKKGAHLHIYDAVPAAMENFKREYKKFLKNCTLYENQYDMFSAADIDGLILGNEDLQFRTVDEQIPMRTKAVFDGKNILPLAVIKNLKENGFSYYSVGRDVCASTHDKKKLIKFLLKEYMD